MSFVRKPRPYSSGQSAAALPSMPTSRPRREPRPVARGGAVPSGPRSSWASAVTALAALGLVLILLVGASGLWNTLARDWQFRSAAAGVSDVVR
ncbi:hypothetical protein [Deinococcus koreensis]|uniref:Uncharacterized protein n=1 Tax=Deinococcus koreensis TaxID=2054903 RepID=A0A2K3V2N4_9DEIO|nr:hypothetical protein [Deinococcus koreensis]PNY83057.1 hypothetical protein CVO96_13260 [Deinococcus koreensis]